MRSGKMDRLITIGEFTSVQDSYGQETETWTEFATVWAEKIDIKARERFAAQQDIAEETTRFRIRWLAGLTPKMRIVHDGKVYNITGIAELGRRGGLEITTEARDVSDA